MRRAILLLVIFGLAGSLWAADPIIGTWKLNVAKSKLPPVLLKALNETAPKEKTEIYQELGDQIVMTVTSTRTSGEKISGKYTWARRGGIAKALEDVPNIAGITIVETLIAPGEWYVTSLKDGNQLLAIHKVVREDGKTMSLNYVGTDAQGKPFEQIDLYDRQ